MVAEFAGAIREHRAPLTDGAAGLRVLSVLEAVSCSLGDGGAPAVPVDALELRHRRGAGVPLSETTRWRSLRLAVA